MADAIQCCPRRTILFQKWGWYRNTRQSVWLEYDNAVNWAQVPNCGQGKMQSSCEALWLSDIRYIWRYCIWEGSRRWGWYQEERRRTRCLGVTTTIKLAPRQLRHSIRKPFGWRWMDSFSSSKECKAQVRSETYEVVKAFKQIATSLQEANAYYRKMIFEPRKHLLSPEMFQLRVQS